MKIKEVLSVSGMPGLYKMVANRSNGLIVTQLGDDKKKFVSSRQHMFTPLENITIYTDDEPMDLAAVLGEMKKSKIKMIEANSSNKDLRDYFLKIIPNHDTEKVYTSDIKKLIKWYTILDEQGLLIAEEEPVDEKTEIPEETKKAKPKKKVAKKSETPKKAASKKAEKPKKQNTVSKASTSKVQKKGSK